MMTKNNKTIINGMLTGISHHMKDMSMKITETKLVSVVTERDDVYKILCELAKANVTGKRKIRKAKSQMDSSETEAGDETS